MTEVKDWERELAEEHQKKLIMLAKETSEKMIKMSRSFLLEYIERAEIEGRTPAAHSAIVTELQILRDLTLLIYFILQGMIDTLNEWKKEEIEKFYKK